MSLQDGLISYYSLNDSTIKDSINLITGSTYNTNIKSGIYNNCLNYNGSSSYSVINEISNLTSFTINCWCYFKGGTTEFYQNFLSLYKNNYLSIGTRNYTSQSYIAVRNISSDYFQLTGSSLNINEWNMITATWNKYQISLQINNEEKSSFNYSTPIKSNNTIDCIGTSGFSDPPEFGWTNGKIDEVGIWNRVLSTSEIEDLYNDGQGKFLKFNKVNNIPLSNIKKINGKYLTNIKKINGQEIF